MKEIPLTQGKVMMVDDADYEWLMQRKWHLMMGNKFYGRTKIGGRQITAHRLIMGSKPGEMVDHKDGDGLNCQRWNLRSCTRLGNARNCCLRRDNPTGFKGVSLDRGSRFRARINFGGKTVHLGFFGTAREAALAYDASAIKLHGEFARTNAMLGLL